MDLEKSGRTCIYVIMVIPAGAFTIPAFVAVWLVFDV